VKALKLANGSPKTKTLRSIYLDTPEHALKRLCLDAIPDASVREEVLRRVNGAPLQPVCARPRPVT
jgi:triphosphatase